MPKFKLSRGQMPSPISLRLTAHEKQQLIVAAKGHTISGYIRHRLFENEPAESVRAARGSFVVKDHQALAKVLALLGKSSLASSMAILADAARIGSLPITEETEAELRHACHDISAIKTLIMKALAIQED